MTTPTDQLIKRFYHLFEKYDFYCNAFYVSSKTNRCRFIGCTHASTGHRVLIDIPEDMGITFDKHIQSTVDNIVLFEDVDTTTGDGEPNCDSVTVASRYRPDETLREQIDAPATHNLDTILADEYKFAVRIDHTNTSSIPKYLLSDLTRQLDRLRHIISPVTHYGIAIESRNVLVYTRLHSTCLAALKLDKEPRDTRALYVVLSLDSFYDKRKTIIDTVSVIHKGIINVLNHNFDKQRSMLKTLIRKCDEAIANIEYIHGIQTQYEGSVEKLSSAADRANTLGKIDCISLCIDKIMFDNIVSYNTIIGNYELLIKMNALYV